LALAGPAAGQLLTGRRRFRTFQHWRGTSRPGRRSHKTKGVTPWPKRIFLDFEQPIAELESKIEELRYVQTESAVDISAEIEQLAGKSLQLTKDIYSNLTPWQITKIARHQDRPYTLDYVNDIFTHFQELHGDRHFPTT
jgi:hypothetical protein